MAATRKPAAAPARKGDRLLRIPEAAKRLGVGRTTAYAMLSDGRLTPTDVGTPGNPILRVRESVLDAFIEARTVPAPDRRIPGRAA